MIKNNEISAILFAFWGYLFFSINDALRKFLIQSYDLFYILFWAVFVSILAYLALAPFLGGVKKTFQTKKWHIHSFRALFAFLTQVCAIYAFSVLPMVDTYTIIFLAPFIIALLSPLMNGEKMLNHAWPVVIVGFLGVIMANRPGFSSFHLGYLAALGIPVFYSLNMLLSRHLSKTDTDLSRALFPSIATIAISAVFLGGMPQIPEQNYLFLFIMSGLLQCGGILLMVKAVNVADTTVSAPIHYMQIVFGGILGYFIFDEVPTFWAVFGGGIVILSALALLYLKHRKVA